jgi:protein-S-isoprenylcysteine O-methyltransferase Ste14
VSLVLAAGWAVHAASWIHALRRTGRGAADRDEWGREGLVRVAMLGLVGAALALPAEQTWLQATPVRALLVLLFLAGQGLAVAARASLGRAWGIGVRPRDGAAVSRGPYAVLAHPIYAGTTLAIFAQLALLQNAAALLLAIGAALIVPVKIAAERRGFERAGSGR